MVYVVYIDVLFAINFIVNYLILFATARLSGAPIKRFRIVLGGAMGALYGVAVFFESMQLLASLWAKVIFAMLMMVISFGFREKRRLIRLFLTFFGLSFAFGGGVLAIYIITRGANGFMEMRNGVFYLRVPLGVLLLSAAVCYAIFSLVFRRSATGATKHEILKVELHNGGRQTMFYALVDSGNSLTDPLTNQAIMIAEYETVRDVLPSIVREILDHTEGDDFALAIEQIPAVHKFKIVPYKTINSSFNMLLAFRPERLMINQKEQKGMLVALSPNRISDGGAYSALTGIEV